MKKRLPVLLFNVSVLIKLDHKSEFISTVLPSNEGNTPASCVGAHFFILNMRTPDDLSVALRTAFQFLSFPVLYSI